MIRPHDLHWHAEVAPADVSSVGAIVGIGDDFRVVAIVQGDGMIGALTPIGERPDLPRLVLDLRDTLMMRAGFVLGREGLPLYRTLAHEGRGRFLDALVAALLLPPDLLYGQAAPSRTS